MKNVLTSLSKSALLPLRLTAATSAIDAAIQNKIYKSGMTAMIISNEEMDDIMKIVKYFEESGLLKKRCLMKQENKKVDFLTCY